MATVTEDSIIVTFDPTAINKQADIIPAATNKSAGLLTAGLFQKLESIDPGPPLPTVLSAEESVATTTTSITDVLMSGMTLTPPAGNYLVWFSGDINNDTDFNFASAQTSIFVGGIQVPASRRDYTRGDQLITSSFMCMARVTVNGSQTIEGHWHTDASSTASNNFRQLFAMKVL